MTSSSNVAGTPIAKALAADQASTTLVGALRSSMLPVWNWLTRSSFCVRGCAVPRRLRIAETVSFGEKRFVSILQVDGEQFLVGGTPSNIILLAKLEGKPEAIRDGTFENVLLHMESDVVKRHAGSDRRFEVAS